MTRQEIANIVDLTDRQIKYIYELKIIPLPSKLDLRGNVDYSAEDLSKVRILSLYYQLGFTWSDIKKMVNDSNFDWENGLNAVIKLQRSRQRDFRKLVMAGELFQNANHSSTECLNIQDYYEIITEIEQDIYDSEKSNITIENAYNEFIKSIEDSNTSKEFKDTCHKIKNLLVDFRNAFSANDIRQQMELFKYIINMLNNEKDISNNEVEEALSIYTVIKNFSLGEIVDMLLGKQGAAEEMEQLIKVYLKNNK